MGQNANTQAWNFIFKRARPFFILHFHWKVLKSNGNFYRVTKAKTMAVEFMACM